jgi:hypothetical protein
LNSRTIGRIACFAETVSADHDSEGIACQRLLGERIHEHEAISLNRHRVRL